MSKPPLGQILNDLINGRIANNTIELRSHLWLQYKEATSETPQNRLCCYRYGGVGPSLNELATVRRELETIQATTLALGNEFPNKSGDGRLRKCRVFSWQPAQPPSQPTLPMALPDDTWKEY